MNHKDDLSDVACRFTVKGHVQSVLPYGSGHINDTYRVTCADGDLMIRYILQRINHELFKDVPGLMDNIERVCSHTRQELMNSGTVDIERRVLTLVPLDDGATYYHDYNGFYWRMYLFIENATGHEVVQNEKQAYEAAKAFGEFQKSLTGLPGERLHDTIPYFHDSRRRFAALESAIAEDSKGRAETCRAEIDWAFGRKEVSVSLISLWEQGLLPERVTHNDTKLNNVLIDNDTDEALCVIDLDTLMPGLALYDFGDLVRTSTSPVCEDETDLSKVCMQMNMYKALARGYLESAGEFLNEVEVDNLALSGRVITFTIGIRFLTDYIMGDVYFKTAYPRHNLDRCRTQFKLFDSMEEQENLMKACVDEVRSFVY